MYSIMNCRLRFVQLPIKEKGFQLLVLLSNWGVHNLIDSVPLSAFHRKHFGIHAKFLAGA